MTVLGLPDAVLSAVVVGVFALPGTVLAHRMGMRKQSQDADAQFDARMLAALDQRDKFITSLQDNVMTMQTQVATQAAQIDTLLTAQRKQDERERVQLQEMAVLKTRVQELDDCKGGHPCPLSRARRFA